MAGLRSGRGHSICKGPEMGKSWGLRLGVQGLDSERSEAGQGAEEWLRPKRSGKPEGPCGGAVCQIQMFPGHLEHWWGVFPFSLTALSHRALMAGH